MLTLVRPRADAEPVTIPAAPHALLAAAAPVDIPLNELQAGIVHAIDLKTGAAIWTLDLAKEPVKLPGANYGGVTRLQAMRQHSS